MRFLCVRCSFQTRTKSKGSSIQMPLLTYRIVRNFVIAMDTAKILSLDVKQQSINQFNYI